MSRETSAALNSKERFSHALANHRRVSNGGPRGDTAALSKTGAPHEVELHTTGTDGENVMKPNVNETDSKSSASTTACSSTAPAQLSKDVLSAAHADDRMSAVLPLAVPDINGSRPWSAGEGSLLSIGTERSTRSELHAPLVPPVLVGGVASEVERILNSDAAINMDDAPTAPRHHPTDDCAAAAHILNTNTHQGDVPHRQQGKYPLLIVDSENEENSDTLLENMTLCGKYKRHTFGTAGSSTAANLVDIQFATGTLSNMSRCKLDACGTNNSDTGDTDSVPSKQGPTDFEGLLEWELAKAQPTGGVASEVAQVPLQSVERPPQRKFLKRGSGVANRSRAPSATAATTRSAVGDKVGMADNAACGDSDEGQLATGSAAEPTDRYTQDNNKDDDCFGCEDAARDRRGEYFGRSTDGDTGTGAAGGDKNANVEGVINYDMEEAGRGDALIDCKNSDAQSELDALFEELGAAVNVVANILHPDDDYRSAQSGDEDAQENDPWRTTSLKELKGGATGGAADCRAGDGRDRSTQLNAAATSTSKRSHKKKPQSASACGSRLSLAERSRRAAGGSLSSNHDAAERAAPTSTAAESADSSTPQTCGVNSPRLSREVASLRIAVTKLRALVTTKDQKINKQEREIKYLKAEIANLEKCHHRQPGSTNTPRQRHVPSAPVPASTGDLSSLNGRGRRGTSPVGRHASPFASRRSTTASPRSSRAAHHSAVSPRADALAITGLSKSLHVFNKDQSRLGSRSAMATAANRTDESATSSGSHRRATIHTKSPRSTCDSKTAVNSHNGDGEPTVNAGQSWAASLRSSSKGRGTPRRSASPSTSTLLAYTPRSGGTANSLYSEDRASSTPRNNYGRPSSCGGGMAPYTNTSPQRNTGASKGYTSPRRRYSSAAADTTGRPHRYTPNTTSPIRHFSSADNTTGMMSMGDRVAALAKSSKPYTTNTGGTCRQHNAESDTRRSARYSDQKEAAAIQRLRDFDVVNMWRPVQTLLLEAATTVVSQKNLPATADRHDRIMVAYSDGHQEIRSASGFIKAVFPAEGWDVCFHLNGDVKANRSDGLMLYHFKSSDIHMVNLPGNSVNFTKFKDSQVEMRDASTSKMYILYPDGVIKTAVQ